MNEMILAADWNRLGPTFQTAIIDTLLMVIITMVVAGLLGLVVGLLLYTTRAGGILKNKVIYTILNVLVNFVRPIPFILLIAAIKPLTVSAMRTGRARRRARPTRLPKSTAAALIHVPVKNLPGPCW